MRFWFQEKSCELAYIDGDEIITWDIAASVVITRNRPGPPKRRRSDRPLSTTNQFFFDAFSTFIVAPDGRSAIYQGKVYQDDERVISYPSSIAWWDFDRQQTQEIEPSYKSLDEVRVFFAPDGRHATIEQGRAVTIFDAEKRIPIATYPEPISVSIGGFSSDGHTIALTDYERPNTILLIDTDRHHRIPIRADRVAIRDSEHLTVVSSGKVMIYSIRNPTPIIVRDSPDDRSSLERVEDLSPDGLHYAFTDDRARKVRLVDVSSPPAPEVPLEGNHSDVLLLSFDPRGEFLACADESEIIV